MQYERCKRTAVAEKRGVRFDGAVATPDGPGTAARAVEGGIVAISTFPLSPQRRLSPATTALRKMSDVSGEAVRFQLEQCKYWCAGLLSHNI